MSTRSWVIKKHINFLEGTIDRIVNDFTYVSQFVDGFKFNILDLHLILKDLEKGFARKQAKLLALRDAHADFRHHIEQLSTQRDNIAQNVEQAVALEAELERLPKTMEELVDLLMKDFI